MATHHAAPGEVVDLETWSNDQEVEKSKVITKTTGLELARLVIEAGVDMHHSEYSSVNGVSVFHCIEGHVTLKTPDKQISIKREQLVFLDAGANHAFIGVEKSVALLSIV
jgi:quercetin dioxygenase-like cupin family protein